MGRKIKGKGCGGVKDPIKQQRAKFEKIKDKIDNPPKNPNDQEVSERFKKISHLSKKKNLFKAKKKKKSKSEEKLLDSTKFESKNIGFYPRKGRPFKPVPVVKQKPQEPHYKFMERVGHATQMVIKESQLEDKYKVDVRRNDSGKVIGYENTKQKSEKKQLRQKERDLKRKLKKQKSKKRKNLGKNEDSEEEERAAKLFKTEDIEFGDIAHRPPTLDTEKLEKKVQKTNVSNYLFIQNLNKKQPLCNVKGSAERKKMLEIERERVVLAYRQLKSQQNNPLLRPKITI